MLLAPPSILRIYSHQAPVLRRSYITYIPRCMHASYILSFHRNNSPPTQAREAPKKLQHKARKVHQTEGRDGGLSTIARIPVSSRDSEAPYTHIHSSRRCRRLRNPFVGCDVPEGTEWVKAFLPPRAVSEDEVSDRRAPA